MVLIRSYLKLITTPLTIPYTKSALTRTMGDTPTPFIPKIHVSNPDAGDPRVEEPASITVL